MSLSKEAIEKIAEMAIQPKVEEIDGIKYSVSARGYSALPKNEIAGLGMRTLTGVVNLIKSLPVEELAKTIPTIIHVASYDQVEVFSQLDAVTKERSTYCKAVAFENTFPFGRFMDREQMMIQLQANFEDTKHKELILGYIGGIDLQAGFKIEDNGVSQSVTAKVGINPNAKIEIPQRVKLKPFRTFPEIEQVESEFVFRVRRDSDSAISCAIFEADGNRWKIEAMARIKTWLELHFHESDDVLIIA